MSFRDCITSAIADGHISRDAGEEYIARYDELAEDIGASSGISWFEAKTEAAVRLQGEIERKLRRKKRMRLFHARSLDRLRARAVPGGVDGAMRAVLDFDPNGEAMTERELRSTVESSYDSILLGGIDDVAVDPKFGSPVNKRITHRELVFTDSKSWLEYQERFGSGDMFSAIVGEIDRLARLAVDAAGPAVLLHLCPGHLQVLPLVHLVHQ